MLITKTVKMPSTHSKRFPVHVGDVRKGKTPNGIPNTFAVLGDSDSDADSQAECMPRGIQKILSDPLISAMYSGKTLWGDLMYEEIDYDVAAHQAAVSAVSAVEESVQEDTGIWSQPFSGSLDMYYGDAYDFRGLTDGEYTACMSWLYEHGWEMEGEDRAGAKAWPANLPPRVWFPVSSQPPRACASACASASASLHEKPAAKRATVPRFCRTAACADASCRYVHDATMPRLDKPCGFGAACGASDPTGVKRSQCLYMHPGETWSADLVIHRPTPSQTP